MRLKLITAAILALTFVAADAQMGGGSRTGGMGMQSGRFYGKVVDENGKPIDASSVQLITTKFDFATRSKKDSNINGQLTEANGDFSLDNVPFMGDYRLKISAIGYKKIEQKISFLTPEMQKQVMEAFASMAAAAKDSTNKSTGAPNMMEQLKKIFGGDMSKMMSIADKDLGNIKLEPDPKQLENVTVTGNKALMTLAIDRKVFNVEKAISTQGQTAVEVMRQIPSVNVDIDGNVTLRNATPTIFVDGRPTTLTLDQIPADAIQSVEIITNPSAKFDASGGTASILNVVMKKNRKNGYNGSVRAGVDVRGRYNLGGDFNIRQKKVNFFMNAMYGQRKSKSTSDVTTNYLATGSKVSSDIVQDINGVSKGYFAFIRAGMDFFIDNRNTVTVAGTYVRGKFGNDEDNYLRYDTAYTPLKTETAYRNTISEGIFRNTGGTVSFKHNFTKAGHEWTADVNYNNSESNNESNLGLTSYYSNSLPKGNPFKQNALGTSNSQFWVIQSDYSNPVSDKAKIDAGVRAQIRDFSSTNVNSYYDYVNNKYITNDFLNTNYKFTDQVLAGYVTYTGKAGNLGYNVGLRAESSNYNGTQIRKAGDTAFKVDYPISLFPSAFVSYKLTDKEDLQFNYTRRINRPNFFQLIPFVDYTSDPLNISQGNSGLKPEFTNSFEANYSNQFNNNNSFLASIYFKHTTDLITRYYDTAKNPFTGQTVNRSTYINANSSTSYGLELTSRNNITKAWDITTNVNFYNASINSDNIIGSTGKNSRFSFYGKINTNYKLGKTNSWTIQLNGDYQGKTVKPVGGGGGGGRGGGMFGGGNQPAGSNGYVNPSYGVDLAIKKEFMKNKAASVTLSMNDIFRTKLRDTYTYDTYFNQRNIGRRDPQILRLQFNWRFGKADINLFKRKNLKGEMEGMSEGMSGAGGN
ncbi:MAG: outer membrane beta-barrel family protein [Chitinophagaceae bacterium]